MGKSLRHRDQTDICNVTLGPVEACLLAGRCADRMSMISFMVRQAHHDIVNDNKNYNYSFTSPCHSGLDPESEILIVIRMTAVEQTRTLSSDLSTHCHSGPDPGISEILIVIRMTLSSYRSVFDKLRLTLSMTTRILITVLPPTVIPDLDPESLGF